MSTTILSGTKRYAIDLAERVGWTAAEAAVGVIAVEAGNWPTWLALPVATGVAIVKGFLARKLGRADSASTARGI